MAIGGAFCLSRLPLYPLEALLQALLLAFERLTDHSTLQLTPVLHHDLSYFQHPFLESHIVTTTSRDPALTRRALEACQRVPGQYYVGRRALERIVAEELASLACPSTLDAAIDLRGTWLPGIGGASPLLLGFSDIASFLRAALAALIPSHRLDHLEKASSRLQQLQNQLLADPSTKARALRPAFDAWSSLVASPLAEARAAASARLPNPFRTENPLSPDWGAPVFRGRQELATQLESLLLDPSQRVSLALLGGRRRGKSSFLRMLPLLAPGCACVFFDLQDNPVDSAAGFFSALFRQTRDQCRASRSLEVPALPDGRPFESASAWLEALDRAAGDRPLLLCIDEFERLEDLFPSGRRDFLRLLGLLRATIQHRRHVRLLVSGVAPFDELDAAWSDHFVNVRELRIGPLQEEEALGLLTRPTDDFPPEILRPEVAEAILKRTGGQPYLVQLYGSLLVQHLDAASRRSATVADLDVVDDRVLTQAAPTFRWILRQAPEEARAHLLAIAESSASEPSRSARRWLQRRAVLDEHGALVFPILARWIREDWEG